MKAPRKMLTVNAAHHEKLKKCAEKKQVLLRDLVDEIIGEWLSDRTWSSRGPDFRHVSADSDTIGEEAR